MNSLFENRGLGPIVIQIISYLDVKSFLKVREVNKTLLYLIDNELSLWRNALKNQMRPIDMTIVTQKSGKRKDCVCIQRWKESAKPFLHSLEALKLLVFFMFEVSQRHFKDNFDCMDMSYQSNKCEEERLGQCGVNITQQAEQNE